MWAEKKRKRVHEWLEGVLGVLGLAPSTYSYYINQKVIKRYQSICEELFSGINCTFSQAGSSNGLLELNNDFIFGHLTFSFSLLGSAIYIVAKGK